MRHRTISVIGSDRQHKHTIGNHNPVDAMHNPKPHPLFVSRSDRDVNKLGVVAMPFARRNTFFLRPTRGG
jgi:hypothetical protein